MPLGGQKLGAVTKGRDELAADEILASGADRMIAAGLDDDSDDYWRSVAEALLEDEVTGANFALVCSAVPAFCEQPSRSSVFIGSVGERIVFYDLTLRRVTQAQNSFRVRRRTRKCVAYRLLFRDQAGNDVVWFSSRAPDAIGIAVGKPCSLKATIRKHADFRGGKQTQITRGATVERANSLNPARCGGPRATPQSATGT